jgi:hypothetical protein
VTPQELAKQLKARPGAERGQWEARCPAHGDRKASLSIGTAKDGSAVLKCHAGCETPEILKVLGLEWRDLWPERESGQQNGHTLGRIVKTYDYRDEHGALLYQVVRYDPKDFRQRRPDRHGGWIWKLGDVRRVPYRLPEILADTSGELWIFEGEKDADRAAALGLNATTTAGGAKSFSKTAEAMRVVATGMHVYCLPDADDVGDVYARTAPAALRPVAASVRSIYLPRLTQQADHGEDFSDWLDAHDGTLEELRMVAGEQPGRTTPAADDHHDQRDGGGDEREDGGDDEEEETASEKKRPPSIAVQLVELAHACEFFHDAEREAWVTFPVGGHKETTRVNAGAFWDWVEHKFHTATGRTANAAAKQEAQGVFRGRAKFDGPQRAVHVRLAEYEGATYVDLADEARQVIKITAQGWDVVPDAPVKFWRPKGLLPLPVPVKGGKIAPLRQFVNITDEQWPLFVGYLVGCLRASDAGGHPVAAIDGEQGSAKSTLARIIKLLLDPNRAPLRSEPSDKRDLAITAQNNRVLAYDNLSGTMQGWLSDSLCRISTGGGHATRQLYTDADEMIFDSTGPSCSPVSRTWRPSLT